VPTAFYGADRSQVTIKPHARIFANDAQALYRLARAGAGLAIVPDFLAEADVACGLMQNVLPDWELDTIDVFAVWPANAPKRGLVHLALDALSEPGRGVQ
jgi:DNA-binding transcriptional LysR family regulator